MTIGIKSAPWPPATVFKATVTPAAPPRPHPLAAGRKLPRIPEGAREFDEFAAFVRATALDKAGRHAEAWQHYSQAI
jgi:hypothetical protein